MLQDKQLHIRLRQAKLVATLLELQADGCKECLDSALAQWEGAAHKMASFPLDSPPSSSSSSSLLAIDPMLFLIKFATTLILDRLILSFTFTLPSQVAPTSNSPPSFCKIRRQTRRAACLGLNAQFNIIWLPSCCLGQNSLLVWFA
jgi:hypothetical protein